MGKTILLSGACGSGKSTLMTLGYRAVEPHWGPTATIDTDTILMMVDPRWGLDYEERRLDLAGYQCGLLAESFLTTGFACVIIGGNGLYTPEEINDLVALLLRLGEVYHVTLDPSLAERGAASRPAAATRRRSGSRPTSIGCEPDINRGPAASTTHCSTPRRRLRRSHNEPAAAKGDSLARYLPSNAGSVTPFESSLGQGLLRMVLGRVRWSRRQSAALALGWVRE